MTEARSSGVQPKNVGGDDFVTEKRDQGMGGAHELH